MSHALVEVLLPVPVDKPFTYYTGPTTMGPDGIAIPPKLLPVGSYVQVPFRNRQLAGIIWDTAEQSKDKLPATAKIKEIEAVSSYIPPMQEPMRQFIQWVARYNMAPLGLVLKMAMAVPSGALFKALKLPEPPEFQPKALTLSQEQEKAAKYIEDKLTNKHSVTVLEGVTGSGKTAVYTKAIEKVLARGGQVLLLLPEIVLTTQLLQRLAEHFCAMPYEWHSGLSQKSRRICWQSVAIGQAKFVAGARSALFLPFHNLQLIIIDEEHDSSFKQEEGVIYNARDMAIVRAKLANIPVVLCSATPSIETVHNIQDGKYCHLRLKNRYGSAVMPKIITIDLNHNKPKPGTWLSMPLRTALLDTMSRGRQSLLFLNRRGYAPITMCTECGYKVRCRHCSACMVEHRSHGYLQCHYCGSTASKVTQCPECGMEGEMKCYGPGAERIAEEVVEFMPEARVALMTSDTVADHKEAGRIVRKISDGEVDVVVGTQMIAKGLHFPKLHLVGVIEADAGLIGGDLRAVERTYQLLHQVAGRAGREDQEGMVMLQTHEPGNLLLQHLEAPNQEEFWRLELEGRQAFNMPPYSRMAIVLGSCGNEAMLLGFMRKLARSAPVVPGIQVLGPAPAPIVMLRNKYRYRFIVNADKHVNLQKLLSQWVASVPPQASITLRVDIDPYSFL